MFWKYSVTDLILGMFRKKFYDSAKWAAHFSTQHRKMHLSWLVPIFYEKNACPK